MEDLFLTDPSCPWTFLREWGVPNVKWCETPRCSWVEEPINTWTNFAYLAASAWFYWRRSGVPQKLASFAPITVFVGLGSLGYHATNSLITQTLDFWGMYAFLALCVAASLGSAHRRASIQVVFGATLATALGLGLQRGGILPFQLGFFLSLVAYLGLEVRAILRLRNMSKREELQRAMPWFYRGLALISAGEILSILDLKRVLCSETFPLGHGLWHVLSAASLVSIFEYYVRRPDPVAQSQGSDGA